MEKQTKALMKATAAVVPTPPVMPGLPYDSSKAWDPIAGAWVPWFDPRRYGPLVNYYWSLEYAHGRDLERGRTWMRTIENWNLNYVNHPDMYDPADRPKPPRWTSIVLNPDYTITEKQGDYMAKMPDPPVLPKPSGGTLFG